MKNQKVRQTAQSRRFEVSCLRVGTQKRLCAVLRWLRHNPQHSVPVALLTLYFGVWLFVPRLRPYTVPPPVPLPVAAYKPALPALQTNEEDKPDKPELQSTQTVYEGHDTWRVEIWWPSNGMKTGCCAKFFRNKRLMRQIYGKERGNFGLEFGKTRSTTRYPVIVLQLLPQVGHPVATCLFTIRHGELIEMKTIGAMNGGPIFRDYDGDGKMEWVFDDYDWYDYYNEGPKYLLVYKELENGKLKLWKRLPNKHRRHLPNNIGQMDWRT